MGIAAAAKRVEVGAEPDWVDGALEGGAKGELFVEFKVLLVWMVACVWVASRDGGVIVADAVAIGREICD
jgi:hypothetical protein